ncbi:hypothetical protein IWZ00DRAFT_96826 [Phyllosticta capitalensis]
MVADWEVVGVESRWWVRWIRKVWWGAAWVKMDGQERGAGIRQRVALSRAERVNESWRTTHQRLPGTNQIIRTRAVSTSTQPHPKRKNLVLSPADPLDKIHPQSQARATPTSAVETVPTLSSSSIVTIIRRQSHQIKSSSPRSRLPQSSWWHEAAKQLWRPKPDCWNHDDQFKLVAKPPIPPFTLLSRYAVPQASTAPRARRRSLHLQVGQAEPFNRVVGCLGTTRSLDIPRQRLCFFDNVASWHAATRLISSISNDWT